MENVHKLVLQHWFCSEKACVMSLPSVLANVILIQSWEYLVTVTASEYLVLFINLW